MFGLRGLNGNEPYTERRLLCDLTIGCLRLETWIETSPNRLKDVEGNPHILPFLYIGFPQINQDNLFAGDLPACQLKPLPFAVCVFHEVITRA